MAKNWEDLGGGQWKLTITDDQNRVPPVTVRGTKDEIIEKLSDSKINGDARIADLKGAKPALTETQRFQMVADLNDPSKVERAITTVVEQIVGPTEEIRRDRAEERTERLVRRAVEAATTFADRTPDWYPSAHNKATLTEYMKRFGLDPGTVSEYTKAFESLKAANLLQPPPDEEDDENTNDGTAHPAERTAPTPAAKPTTPTRYSTGVRSTDVSGTRPTPTNRLKYTREQIDGMSRQDYKEKMNDPEFVKAVDHFFGGQRRTG